MKKSFLILILSALLALGYSEGVVWPVLAAAQQPLNQPPQAYVGNASFVYPSIGQNGVDSAGSHSIKAGVFITLVPPIDTALGAEFTLSGTITDWSGNLLSGESIIFTINGAYLGQTSSNKKGLFQQTFKKIMDAGIYTIEATFNGTHDLSFASSATTLKILPADVKVQTVPPTSGVTFQLNGKQFVSGEDGSADIKINKAGSYRLEALVSLYNDPSQRIEFGRWLDESYQPFLDIQVPTGRVLEAGLNIYNLVGQSFVDLDGVPVDPQRLTEFSIRSEQGDTFTLNDGESRWIPASRITRRVDGLVVTKLLYSVISVKVDGSNVVNVSQQQFYAQPNDNWKISLLLYSLGIRVNDGLFDSATGKSVNLTFPDGQVKNYPLDQTGSVEIHSLARGNYSIQVIGVKGIGNRMPIALSRNQDATMKVLTYLDLAIVGALGAFIALALLLYGRRGVLVSSLRKHQGAPRGVSPAALQAKEIQPADGKDMRPNNQFIRWS